MEAMARDQKVIEALKTHTPAIRNTLLLLLSQQDYETMHTVEGKEQLREAAREEINLILEAQAGISGVEAVFFTGICNAVNPWLLLIFFPKMRWMPCFPV